MVNHRGRGLPGVSGKQIIMKIKDFMPHIGDDGNLVVNAGGSVDVVHRLDKATQERILIVLGLYLVGRVVNLW